MSATRHPPYQRLHKRLRQARARAIRVVTLWTLVGSCSLNISSVMVEVAQGAPADDLRRSSPRAIEATLRRHLEARLVTRYEIGEVDWTSRALRTLGVGAHTVLSPTGGWGHTDLAQVATANALHQISRLSAELYPDEPRRAAHAQRDHAPPLCDRGELSRHFNAPRPLWMSDGSVHLSATIRFEVYELCLWGELRGERPSEQRSSASALDESLRALESTIARAAPRAVISLSLIGLDDAELLRCLTPTPTLAVTARDDLLITRSPSRAQDASEPHPKRWWRAVRWLRDSRDEASPTSSRERVEVYIKPTLELGEALCERGSRLQLEGSSEIKLKQRLTPSQLQALKRALDHPDGAELWLWVSE